MLEAAVHSAAAMPRMRVGGVVTAVTPGYCRVSGLSEFVKLGESVSLVSGGKSQLGEVVRVDETGATIKAFEAVVDVGLGTAAWRKGPITISPHPGWKGRILNALGHPIDGEGPLPLGGDRDFHRARTAGADAAQAGQHAGTDGRSRYRSVHPDLRRPAHRHLRGIGHRQVDAARHADALARLR